MTVLFTLIILIFYPYGGFEKEVHPIEAPACKEVNGVRVEDSNCGIGYCLRMGRERSAEIWGQNPGVGFGLMCQRNDGGETQSEGAEPSPGHGGMNWDAEHGKQ